MCAHTLSRSVSRAAFPCPASPCVSLFSRPKGRRHTILTSRELMLCYACSWDVRGDLTLNSMAQIHTSLCFRHVISRGTLVGSRASTPLTILSSHTFFEAWPTCRVLLSVSSLWLCLSCEGTPHALSSGYDHIVLWLRGNSLCSFRHTCVCHSSGMT